ncbi:MAG: TonB-dependent receptor [Muribaculaceae bacterium]|nr:TonB-dependent receptor [Muribaculaceae bacterium]
MLRRVKFLALVAMFFVALSVNAQVTTSALSGVVTDENQEAMIGATVTALHTPSGTQYNAVTNMDGRYSIKGMRPGGPYTVTVSYIGYQTRKVEDVTLQLAETYDLNVDMSVDANTLGEVVVTSEATKFRAEKTGAATNINSTQITNLPTVTRSLTDVTRLSPFGGNGMSFAGTDGRLANFTVDGANFNNNFGLSDNLPGGGNPISIEAIEEMQVVISPYDVRQTNFIGGGVNAITKSGTNTFRGSAYIFHRNENMRGDAVDRVQLAAAREKDQVTTYGFTLGGPIWKNKLFFFVNGEMTKQPTIVNRWRASQDGVGNADQFISRTTVDDLERVKNHVMNKYGYDTGSYTSFPADENNYKLLARLDWNINADHHLSLRYNYTKNRYWSNPNGTSMDGGTRMPNYRVSMYSFSFANSMYGMDNLVHSFSANLNSRLTDNLSNEFLATFSKLDDIRATNSSEFPFIDITMTDEYGSKDNYMALGYELFTWNNAVHNTIWNLRDDVTWYYGNHKIMGGLSFEHQMADNQYMRNGTGYYRYNSVDDFINGAAPEVVCLTYGYGSETKPAARVQFNKAGLYAQDEWNVTRNFKLTYGLRLDGLFFNNGDLITNNAILKLDYYDKNGDVRHIDTGKWPNSNLIVQPRVGFSWDVMGNNTLKLRGGSGLFSGRLPLVFFTNMPTNGGLVQYQAQLNANTKIGGMVKDPNTGEMVYKPSRGYENYTGAYTTDANGNRYIDMSQFAGGLVTDANGKATIDALRSKLIAMGYPENVTSDMGTVPSSISAVDPKFKMPMVWKTSLAVDYNVPVSFPFTVTVEGIFNKNINAASISDWSMPSVGGYARFNGVDNRPIFPAGFRRGTKAFVLENTSRGYGWIGNVTLNARPVEWLSLMAAYTHTVNKEVTGMPGSAAESAFTYVPTVEGPNNIKLHNSQYVTPDRFVLSATGHDRSGNHYGLIYETWRGGYNYSYMMANDMNGDGYNYDVMFIPTDEQVANREFRFVSEGDKTRFMDYVHNNSYLKNHQGEYAEAYSLYSPWVHRIDLSYKHDFSFIVCGAKHTLQLSLDVKNVMNLFNSSWGVSKYLNPEIGSDPRILKYEGVDAEGYATFSTPASINGDTKTFVPNKSIGQCWNASIGIKYIFN